MATLDHVIVRVRNLADSVTFYKSILGFAHDGYIAPFEVIRVNDGLTLDLMEQAPQDPMHLAFALPAASFDEVTQRLVASNIPYGSSPYSRESRGPGMALGARGMAKAIYFSDPDGHNLEIRLYAA